MSIDLLRTQVKDFLDYWTDSDDHDQDALLRMLARHLQPSQMVDSQQSVKAKITAGPAPWDDPIAHLLADIAAGSRTIERGLLIALRFNAPPRGGSDGNTRVALGRIPDLVSAIVDNDTERTMSELVAEARITIGMWHRAALLLLGAERRWAHIRTEVEVRDINGTLLDVHRGIAVCPYCENAIRIQPDLADAGDKDRWACAECTSQQVCSMCTHRDIWAAVDLAEELARIEKRKLTWQMRQQIAQAVPNVYGCEHVAVYGCPHVKARHFDIGPAVAKCVDRNCVDDNGHRHSWPVDEWLGRLLTWKRDTSLAGAAS